MIYLLSRLEGGRSLPLDMVRLGAQVPIFGRGDGILRRRDVVSIKRKNREIDSQTSLSFNCFAFL